MFAGVVRSGLTETRHEVVAAAVAPDGTVIDTLGDGLDRPFFARSALKPFQALVSRRSGAALSGEPLAVACASHGAFPIHLAYVRSMLEEVDLDEDALRCPPARPGSRAADRLAAVSGDTGRRRIHHNCSGKHAAMLRACVASGWSLEYLDVDHPLQRRIVDLAAEVTGADVTPVGVDGCGVPTMRTTVAGLARAFARLAVDDDYEEIRTAMSRFPALTSYGDRPYERLATWIPAAVKGGAEGCVGLAWYGGVGIAAKCWSGNEDALMAAVVELADRIGILAPHPRDRLADVAASPVLGGGRPVGQVLLEVPG
ncbi:MAG: asparaginase [Acidimicrobiia bacterium]|nr:asparaginase [Acidimicrobiia bacterium]